MDTLRILGYREWTRLENRRAWWRGRYAHDLARDFCSHCARQSYCKRLRINEFIIIDVLTGKGCPDYNGAWNRIFDERIDNGL